MDLYTDREKIIRFGWKICEFFCGIIDGFGKVGMDGIFFSDDLGFARQLIFSPDIFREVFKPWYKEIFERIHKNGMHVIMHSCGYLWEIIPDLIEIGLDVHHFQPFVMDMNAYVREFGKDLTFFGGIDIQKFMIDNDPEGIRNGIKEIFQTLDHDGGGFMAGPSNTLMSDTPYENIVAMYEAMNEFAPRSKL
jgi:uroporphyrinogen decarboxylase